MPTPIGQAVIFTDNLETESSMKEALGACGLQAVVTRNLGECRGRVREAAPDLILVDADHQEMDGLTVVDALRDWVDPARMVLLVSERSMKRAAAAPPDGALWYLKKPVGVDELSLMMRQSRRIAEARIDPPAVYGSSPETQSALKTVGQVAPRPTHLLIAGESGTGKRLFSRLVHWRSPRRSSPFALVSCSGLSAAAMRDELFGSSEGIALGEAGCLDRSTPGTVVIDDIDQLDPLSQERLFEHLKSWGHGDSLSGTSLNVRPSRVRLIGVTRLDLEAEAHEGRFHSGLLHLLGSVTLRLAPLRERPSDIPLLSDQFCRAAAERAGKPVKGVSTEALALLMAYDWPGNVRELKHVIENAVAQGGGEVLGAGDLPVLPERAGRESRSFALGTTIQEIEREAILRTLEAVDGSTTRAAKHLNMSVRKIQYKVKEYREESAALVSETVRAPQRSSSPQMKNDY